MTSDQPTTFTPHAQRTVKVMLVDDHPLVRHGLAQLIDDEPDMTVCAQAANAQEALRAVDSSSPDLVIIDISLGDGGGGNGLELVKQIRSRHARIQTLVLSMHDESLFAERALRAGARGYVSKQQAMDTVVDAIRQVVEGKIYLSSQMTDRMLHRAVGKEEALEHSPIENLSDRELEVFEFIGQGLTTRQIANRMQLSPKTVETYRENIKTKLNLSNASELTRHAVQWVLDESS